MKILVTETSYLTTNIKKQLETIGPVKYGPFDKKSFLFYLPSVEIILIRLSINPSS